MRRHVFVMLLLPGWCQIAPSLAIAVAQPAKNPPEPKRDCVGVPHGGTLTEITKDSITISWADEKPRRFLLSETLASGEIPSNPRPYPGLNYKYAVPTSHMYRLTDVKVGDCVSIMYAHIGGVSICDHISINKRPGGRVPPLPEGVENLKPPMPNLPKGVVYLNMIPYHERMNAYWDLEEKGIPYPEKFGRYRRWPEAPMPREVGVSGRPISQ